MITHQLQLDQLLTFDDDKPIKVITGVRRCGKTILLRQVKDALRRRGVSNEQLHFIRFNQLHRQQLIGWSALTTTIKKEFVAEKVNYLFCDELDQLDHASCFLQEMIKDNKLRLLVTTSTRSLLTRLAPLQPRLDIIPILPLGFAAFCHHHHLCTSQYALYQYLNTGGFPFVQDVRDPLIFENYLDEVFNTILVGGFNKHGTLCNPFLTKQLAIFLANQLGTSVNTSKAVSGLKDGGIPASNKTLANYLAVLQDTFLFYPCYEIDLASNRIKPTNVKYYPVDPSLRNYLTNKKGALSQANLEALLFIELVRRGYSVHSNKQVTFIADLHQQRYHLQFAYSLRNQHDYNRAIAGLRTLPADSHKQLIVLHASDLLTQDPVIPLATLTDWLTGEVNY